MKTVSARDANQGFSRLLAEAAAGEEILITRRGRPVARLVPVAGPAEADRRAAAKRRLLASLRKGLRLGGVVPARAEIYGR
jgi:prevent-host-death family protein